MCSAHISHAALSCPLQKAFNALCHSTHLYGRRLVLEWADSEVTVQALRRKTARHFQGRSGLVLAWPTGGLLGLGAGAGAACGAALAWVQPPPPPEASCHQPALYQHGHLVALRAGRAVGARQARRARQLSPRSLLWSSIQVPKVLPRAQGCRQWVLEAGPRNPRVTRIISFPYAFLQGCPLPA